MKKIAFIGLLSLTLTSMTFAQTPTTNPYLAPPLRDSAQIVSESTDTDATKSPLPKRRANAPFRNRLGIKSSRPMAADDIVQPKVVDVEGQKEQAIQTLLQEVGDLHPGDYGPREKLLEILQLDRLIALRNAEIAKRMSANASAADGTIREQAEEAFALRTSIWTIRDIPVTWDCSLEDFDRYATERQWVRDAIALTWERESAVRFTGWGRSQDDDTAGIRIAINDEGPHCKRLGRMLDKLRAGMVLNFTFGNWCPTCAVNIQNSIQYIAVHEFGHALGLAHEQNRSDAPSWCQEDRQGRDGDWFLTIYDPQSIMNYCSESWNNNGELTELDKRAIRIMYGNPRNSTGRSTARPAEGPFPIPLKSYPSEKSPQPNDNKLTPVPKLKDQSDESSPTDEQSSRSNSRHKLLSASTRCRLCQPNFTTVRAEMDPDARN